MPDLAHWSVFLTATLILLVIPGPSVIYVLTQAMDHGRRGALLASLGLASGDFAQAVLTALGLSALLASSAVWFQAVKYGGAAYLVFLGIRRLRRSEDLQVSRGNAHIRNTPASSLIAQAFFALNPKTALFFVALFPQVIDIEETNAGAQMLLFGTVFTVVGFVTNFVYGSVGGRMAARLTTSRQFRLSARYATAATLIGLGLVAAVS
jgi:threonine/homoserine/homoserine lactone efflux protein